MKGEGWDLAFGVLFAVVLALLLGIWVGRATWQGHQQEVDQARLFMADSWVDCYWLDDVYIGCTRVHQEGE